MSFLVRDFPDVISSFYSHIRNYSDPDVDLNELWRRKLNDWFSYNMKWMVNKNELPVMYVHYEDLIANKEIIISRLAEFTNIPLNQILLDRVISRTSLTFMKTHQSKFGEQPETWKVYNNFIRNGKAGEGKGLFSPEQLLEYENAAKKFHIGGTGLERYFK